jgi:Prokaryotic E2 family E
MALPDQLARDIESLREDGYSIEVTEDGNRYYIVFAAFAIPSEAYLPRATDVMVMADYQYPMSRMDMFWTDPEVCTVSGGYPQNADQFEEYGGRRWQRWSWHYPNWNPACDNVRTHLEVVLDRLARGT